MAATAATPGASPLGSDPSNFVIAVLSYKRHNVIGKKTLKVLRDAGLINRTTVFVANEEERALYAPECSDVPIVVGVVGMRPQRQFIHNYYPTDTLVVSLDDDITAFKTIKDGKLVKTTELREFFTMAFKHMLDSGARIWGIYATDSKMYMERQPAVSYGLSFLIGVCYGIIVRDVPQLSMSLKAQADKELTLKYWVADKKLVRFNHWAVATRFMAPGGLYSETRKEETKAETAALVELFPGLITQIYKPRMGIYDNRFVGSKTPRTAVRAPGDDRVDVLPVAPTYEAAKERLLAVLRATTIPPLGKESPPERRKHHGVRADIIGSVGRSISLGIGNTRVKGWAEFRHNKKKPALLKALIEFGNTIAPSGWKYTTITLNHGVLARKHKDGNNVGRSIIVGIGEYTGGKLRVWAEDESGYQDCDLKDKPTMFNGALRFHETQPFEGERYTIIYYHGPKAGNCEGMPEMIGEAPISSTDLIQLA